MQKEFKNLLSAIDKWAKVNAEERGKAGVCFIGSFVSFDGKKAENDEEDIIKDAIMVGYGGKEELELSLKELQENLRKEKGFVNLVK